MKNVNMIKWVGIAASAWLLSSCGGGGGGSAPTGSNTGVLTDSAIQGVAYSTSPSKVFGVTDAQGQYHYNPGDTVT